MTRIWKKGRGKLGFLAPLLGSWTAEADSPMGRVRCRRSFSEVLNGSYIRVDARWEFLGGAEAGQWAGKAYQELALMGVGDDRNVWFWSFTSDGKRSQGFQSDVTELHPEAVGFEADMPAAGPASPTGLTVRMALSGWSSHAARRAGSGSRSTVIGGTPPEATLSRGRLTPCSSTFQTPSRFSSGPRCHSVPCSAG